MVKRFVVALGIVLAAGEATAAGWSQPERSARLQVVSSSDLFPGSSTTGPDVGLRAEGTLGSATRLAEALKLGLEARAGAEAWRRFEDARSGWLGGGISLRHGRSQLATQVEWTPHRLKFAEDSGNAAFRRVEWRLGVRSALGRGLGLRVEGRLTRDDYVAGFDARDARSRAAVAQLTFRASDRLTLRAERTLERTMTASVKYANQEPVTGGGATWDDGRWRLEAGVRSGIRRYTEARPVDSNFHRRDQWLELAAALGRRFRPGARLVLGGTLLDQTSSRVDRNFAVYSFRVGIELDAAGR